MLRLLARYLTPRQTLIASHLRLEDRVRRQAEEIQLLERQRDALVDLLDRVKWTACADSAAAKGFIEHLSK